MMVTQTKTYAQQSIYTHGCYHVQQKLRPNLTYYGCWISEFDHLSRNTHLYDDYFPGVRHDIRNVWWVILGLKRSQLNVTEPR